MEKGIDSFIINLKSGDRIIPLSVCVTHDHVVIYRDDGQDTTIKIPKRAFGELIDWIIEYHEL